MLTLGRFFDTDELSDVTIKFSGRVKRCHKVILCSHSEYFQGLCGANSKFVESGQAVIELKDDEDPDAVEAMIAHIYSYDYSDHFKDKADDAIFHFNVLVTAKKYLVPKLASRASVKFLMASGSLMEDPDKAWSMMQQHAKYPDQDEGVDEIVKELKGRHLRYLLTNTEAQTALCEDDDFRQLINDRLDAAEFFKEELQKVTLVTCCGGRFFEVRAYPAGQVWCESCGRVLVHNGQVVHGASYRDIWERVPHASG